MITVFQANEFGNNTKGYTKVAEVDVETINEAFRLTQNIEGSWSREKIFQYDGVEIINEDYDPRIKVTADLIVCKRTGQVWVCVLLLAVMFYLMAPTIGSWFRLERVELVLFTKLMARLLP